MRHVGYEFVAETLAAKLIFKSDFLGLSYIVDVSG